MTMPELTTILAAYTSIVLTIIGGIMAFMLYHFIPLKMRVSTMWHDLYDDDGRGHIQESDEERESIRDMLRNAQNQHEKIDRRTRRVIKYLGDLSTYLDDDGDRDAPHIYEDNYVEGSNLDRDDY